KLIDFIGQLFDWAQRTWPEVLKIANAIGEIMTQIGTIMRPIMDFIAQNVQMKDVLIALGIVLGVTLIAAIGAFVAAWGPALALFAAIVGAVALVRKAFETDFWGLGDKVRQVAQEIGDWLGALPDKLSGLGDTLRSVGQTAISKLREGFDAAKGFVVNGVD